MPERAHKTVTTIDFNLLDRQIKGVQSVIAQFKAEPSESEAGKRMEHIAEGVLGTLTWMAGGPAGADVYVILEEAEHRQRAAHYSALTAEAISIKKAQELLGLPTDTKEA